MRYKITFLDYWHLSSGLSSGAKADSTVLKDKVGLPYFSGKTIKGLVREMAELTEDYDFVTKCFGSSSEKKDKFYSEKKIFTDCYFSDATLEENTKKEIVKNHLQANLYSELASTKIDENGIAATGSLREIEVVIPMTLYGTIENIPNEYKDEMISALKKVKRAGLNRNRGLGRCKIEILGEQK